LDILLKVSDSPTGEGQPDKLADAEPPVEVRGGQADIRSGQGVLIGAHGQQVNNFFVAGAPARRAAIAFSGTVESPYRGLSSFGEQDAAFFFGREAAAEEILQRLPGQADAPALLVVSGASGAGKSSLLRAGVLPRLSVLAPGHLPWPHLVLTPARAPLSELAAHVARLVGKDAATLRQALRADSSAFALIALEAAGPRAEEGRQARLVLVVDQFEQLFTRCPDEAERRQFITALAAAATIGHGSGQVPAAVVILVVRADFEIRCLDYGELVAAVQHRYLVPPMTGPQLELAITEPARTAGSAVDDALVGKLVRAIREVPSPNSPGPGTGGTRILPHLSHALDQAWRGRDGDTLTLADFERTGGIEGSIGTSADRAYERLNPGQQEAARQVFTRLTAASAEGTFTADRAGRAELTEGKSPAEAADVEAVLEAFAAERLLTLTADSVELSHEVLLTAWPLLRDSWLADSRADQVVRTQLRRAAADWAGHGNDQAYLLRGSLLDAADGIAARISSDPGHNPPLSRTEQRFLRNSSSARRRVRRTWQGVGAVLVVLTLAAGTAAVVASENAQTAARNEATAKRDEATAKQQHAIALSRQLAAESLVADQNDGAQDHAYAEQLAAAAWAVSQTAQAGSAMMTLLAENVPSGELPTEKLPDGLPAIGVGPEVLSNPVRYDGMLRPVTPPVTISDKGIPGAVAFSPDSKLLAVAGDDTVQLSNPADGQPVGQPIPAGAVNGMAFSPNSQLLATAASNGTVRLWSTADGQSVGQPIRAGTTEFPVQTVTFSPNSQLLATTADGTARLWNLANHQPAGQPIPETVYAVAFSPNGKLLATADYDGSVRLWNPVNDQPAGEPIRARTTSTVYALAFTPGGKLLATVDPDGTLFVSAGSRRPSSTPVTPREIVNENDVAFNPSGTLFAFTKDNTVVLSSPGTGQAVEVEPAIPVTPANTPVDAVAFSPNGKSFATASEDGTVKVWNVQVYTDPYGALCASVGPLSRGLWGQEAAGEPYPKVCTG
jgi:WD40 repeat protein